MEKIKFIYEFSDPDIKDTKTVVLHREDTDGLTDTSVCEMFVDFMNSVGYSENNVFNYFNESE